MAQNMNKRIYLSSVDITSYGVLQAHKRSIDEGLLFIQALFRRHDARRIRKMWVSLT